MSQAESDLTTLLRECQQAVDRLWVERGWRLLGREQWAQRTLDQLLAGPNPNPSRAAIFVYTQAMYAACSGDEGEQRQNQAYQELFRYLYDGARRRYPAFAEDVTQRAIERIFILFERCRSPGAFLAFAFQQLMDAARTVRRQESADSSARALSRSASRLALDRVADPHADLATHVIAAELRARFDNLSIEFLHKHPRAAQQLIALRLKYIDGLDEATISRQLGKSVGSVYVLRNRAIEKLRAEPAWRALAIEFGIFPDEV